MFKFEMQIGWSVEDKITIETSNFDVIESLKDFIEFQEAEGWIQCYEFSAIDDEEDETEEEELDETLSGQAI